MDPLDEPPHMGESLPELVAVMQRLLGPEGCPWDREQTFQSLRPYVLEEAHEVVAALDADDRAGLKEELGDLLLQVVFLAELARAEGSFHIGDVISAIREKLVRRHPWVFGQEREQDPDAALARWERIKAQEKAARGERKGALEGVPLALPALLRALRVGEKAAAVGYDWPDARFVRAKVDEELHELDEAMARDEASAIERELGDVLFAMASLGRKLGIDPEAALRGALDRFSTRFGHAERLAETEGKPLADLDETARDRLWERAKAREITNSGSAGRP